jgi:hypothetical protein
LSPQYNRAFLSQSTPDLDRNEFTGKTELSSDNVKAAVKTGSPDLPLDLGGWEIALGIFQQSGERVGKSRVDVTKRCNGRHENRE